MPYLKQAERKLIDEGFCFTKAGELNYKLTKVCLEYVKDKGKCYATYNDIVGALECCKLEFYRRLASIYEDDKIEQNGDVYE